MHEGAPLNAQPVSLGLLEIAVNRYLRLDPRAVEKLGTLSGKMLALEVVGLPRVLYLVFTREGISLAATAHGSPDARVRGTPGDLLHMLKGQDAGERVFAGHVTVEGDTRLVHTVKAILEGVDVDWEEELAKFSGDPIARQAGNLARAVRRWRQDASQTLRQDLAEYLVEEARVVARGEEVQAYSVAVDKLRDDAARLDKRIARLMRSFEENGV